jgi:hypothetical protein
MKKLKVISVNINNKSFVTDCPFKDCETFLTFRTYLYDGRFYKAHCDEYEEDVFQKPPRELL